MMVNLLISKSILEKNNDGEEQEHVEQKEGLSQDDDFNNKLFNQIDPKKFLDVIKERPVTLTPNLSKNRLMQRRPNIILNRQKLITIKNATVL